MRFRGVAVPLIPLAMVIAACGAGDGTSTNDTQVDSQSTEVTTRVKNAALSSCPANVTNVVTWAADVAGAPGTCTGTFVASNSWTPPAGVSTVTYLVVGGGGGGWSQNTQVAQLGGAGGQVKSGTTTLAAGAVSVVVGAGGAGAANGNDSSFSQGGVALVTASKGLTNAGPNGAGANGTTSSITGTAVIYGSSGGKGGGYAGGSGAGAGAAMNAGCAGGLSGVANRGGGGGGGTYYPYNAGGFTFPCYTVAGSGGSGIVVLQYNTFSVTSFTTSATSPTSTTGPIAWTLEFSAAIDGTTLSASDFTNGGTATGCQFSVTQVSTTTYTISVSNCSEGTITPTLAAGSIAPAAGGTGPGSAAVGSTLTIDRTAPVAPSAVDLAASSDTGSSSTDNITNDTTPTMSATPSGAVSGDTITLNATKTGSDPVSCSYVLPATSCDLPTMTDGNWNISATHTDVAGNVSPASAPLPLTIDTAAGAGTPDLVASSDTGQSSTDNVTNDTTPAVGAVGVADFDTVTMTASKSGSANVTCSYVKSPTVNSCDLGTLGQGDWAITSSVTDPAGNSAGPTGGLTINIDTTAPTAPTAPDLLPSSDSGASNTDNKTSDTTPSMSGGTVPDGSKVTISGAKADGSAVSCEYVASPTVSSCDLPTMTDGDWSMTSKVTDPAGNQSSAGPALPLSIDSTAPATPTAVDLLLASDTGTSFTDNVTNDDTPAVAATPVGGVNGESITMTASKPGTASVSCTYVLPATSCDLPALSDGTWDVTAKHTDLSGNVSPASAPLSIKIDTSTVAGTPDLISASDTGTSTTDNLTKDNTPAISADGEGDGDRIDVTATKADGSTLSCTYVKSSTVNSCDLPTMSDGDWSITTTTTDPAGNTSPASAPLPLKIDTAAPTTPSAPDLLPASDLGAQSTDDLTNDTTPTASAGTVPEGSNVTMTAAKADGSTVSCTYVASPTVTNCDLPSMSNGDWSLTAMIADPAGNESAPSPALPMTIDSTPPATPAAPDLMSASDTGSSNVDNLTADATPAVSLTAVTNGDTVTLIASKSDGSAVTCSYVKSATVGSCDLPTMSDGAWKVSGTVADPAGNVSAASPALDMTIDTTPPVAAVADLLAASDLGSSDSDNLTSDTTPAISAPTASNGDKVTITAKKSDGTVVSCTYTKSATVNSCDLETLTDGSWTLDASVVDSAGNKSPAGSSLALVIDTRPPSKPATPTLPVSDSGSTSNPTPDVVVDGVTPGDTVTGIATNILPSTNPAATGGEPKTVTCVFVGAPGVRSCKLPMLTPGQWFISAKVTDPSGNTSASSDAVSVTINDPSLPLGAVSLSTVAAAGGAGVVNAVANLKDSEVGNVANVVFVVRNADGSVARTVRVAADPASSKIATKIAGLAKGQRVDAYTENWLGVSRAAPAGTNVVRAATSRVKDKSGAPKLIGSRLAESRVIFDPASPLLDAGDKATLDKFVARVVGKGGLVLVSGFARQNQIDTKGFLRDLSIDRAKAVADYLSVRGVRAWIRYQGFGATTKQVGTWEDRKVEIRWVNGASELPAK